MHFLQKHFTMCVMCCTICLVKSLCWSIYLHAALLLAMPTVCCTIIFLLNLFTPVCLYANLISWYRDETAIIEKSCTSYSKTSLIRFLKSKKIKWEKSWKTYAPNGVLPMFFHLEYIVLWPLCMQMKDGKALGNETQIDETLMDAKLKYHSNKLVKITGLILNTDWSNNTACNLLIGCHCASRIDWQSL